MYDKKCIIFELQQRKEKDLVIIFSLLVIISYLNDYIWMLYFSRPSHSRQVQSYLISLLLI
jgi:hypothetical protein